MFKKTDKTYPNPEAHQHKFYYMTSKSVFEPVQLEHYKDKNLYERIEYIYLMCNSPCNAVKRVLADDYNP